ncbi:MAG: thioredoxin family protein [Candidatus Latescibacterota bacterium]|nr:thioredoxin family protein [Candidatus Latescibacterota bacterium]
MLRLAPSIFLLGLACLLAGRVGATPAPSPFALPVAGDHPVHARLIVDRKAGEVALNDEFYLGIHLRMEPDWHTYWENSGDSGLPTKIKWELPPGYEAGPIEWPGPHRYEEMGGLISYGYADETLLLTPIRRRYEAQPGGSFIAHVSWLVCREVCIPGDTTLTIDLLENEPDDEQLALFARYRERVPQRLTDSDPVGISAEAFRADQGVGVRVRVVSSVGANVDDSVPDFFPLLPADHVYLEHVSRDRTERGHELELRIVPYDAADEVPSELSGVVAYRLDSDEGWSYRAVGLAVALDGSVSGDLLHQDYALSLGEPTALWIYLLMAIVGGLILNLMPCVLPVISLKVLALMGQADESDVRVRTLGLAFTAGVIATFVGLALLVLSIKAGGEQIGWGFQFQSPHFILFLTALVYVLSLSLFGLVEVPIPGFSNLVQVGPSGGLTGSFLNGVLATVLATPCTAPFLGSALGFAFAASGVTVIVIFAAAGVGMALPYLLLAAHPAWIRHLPRPGEWTGLFKQGMGFLLVATVLWLLWVLGKQMGMEAVVWTSVFLLCVTVAVWIPGSWVNLRSSVQARRLAWLTALVIVGLAYQQILAPMLASEARLASGDSSIREDRWMPFSVAAVESMLASNRHVFIDFTAEWCWTCKVNEQTVLNEEEVVSAFDEHDVALIKADWTNRNSEITQLLSSFGRSGVPLYVIFPAGKPQQPLVLPELLTSGIVLQQLAKAVRISAGG